MDKPFNDQFETKLYPMTTLITTKTQYNDQLICGQATAFFYSVLQEKDKNIIGGQWLKFKSFWLITNKHVVIQHIEETEIIVDEIIFRLRKIENSLVNWIEFKLDKNEIVSRIKLHNDPNVDVCVINITDIIEQQIAKLDKEKIMMPLSLSNLNLPENQPLNINVTSDVVVVSYPEEFYDKTNKFPIVKSGIIASAWNKKFNGLDMFQIDVKLFPGSSGGLVISKPTQIAMIDGKICSAQQQQFVFLGIYSGEYTKTELISPNDFVISIKKSYGLGSVWYSYLVKEIINNGKNYLECINNMHTNH